MSEERSRKERDYEILVQLLINENDRYHGILSTYLTANSILVAVSFLAIDKVPLYVVIAMAALGIFICFQWKISLSRSKKLSQLRLRQLRITERYLEGSIFLEGQRLIVEEKTLPAIREDGEEIESELKPHKHANRWYGKRAAFMPWVFGFFYVLVIVSKKMIITR